MKSEDFESYVKARYEKEIAWYDKKANWNHAIYQIFQWLAIILSSLTAILIIIGEAWVRWLAVGVAVIVAIVTSGLKTFKYQENWINYRTTSETLRKEIYYYRASTHGYDSVGDKEALFVERVESLISRENTMWVVNHEKDENQKVKK